MNKFNQISDARYFRNILILSFVSYSLSFNIDPNSHFIFRPDHTLKTINQNSLYFSYSLALHNQLDQEWLLVGAPRANTTFSISEKLISPGCVFICKLKSLLTSISNTSQCLQLQIDEKELDPMGYKIFKNDQMFGASISSFESKTGDKHILVCSPNAKIDERKDYHFGKGACYKLNPNLNNANQYTSTTETMYVMNDPSKINHPITHTKVYNVGFAQLGFSNHILKNGWMLIGAPGMLQWRGGLFVTNNSVNCTSDTTMLEGDSYLGYKVSSIGLFKSQNSNISFVASAPRNKIIGKVQFYNFKEPCSMKNIHLIEGNQFGSYFGNFLLVLDVNNDEREDLFISAMLFNSSIGDEGAVFFYINHGESTEIKLEFKSQLSGSSKPKSRFGTAMASLGDINKDGFNDVAISSLTEENGVVYIYLGNNEGVNDKFSQRLSAKQVDTNLRGFGFSLISYIGKSGYSNLVVGSHVSDTVSVFQSHPIHWITVDIKFSNSNIEWQNADCSNKEQINYVNVTLTFIYQYKKQVDYLDIFLEDIIYEARIDYPQTKEHRFGKQRGTFLIEKSSKDKIREQIKFSSSSINKPITKEFILAFSIQRQPRHIEVPVNFHVNFSVNSSISLNKNKIFYDNYSKYRPKPILDSFAPTNFSKEISFQKECSGGNVCHPILEIDFYQDYLTGVIILGANKNQVIVKLNISNKGDSEYALKLIAKHPSVLQYEKVEVDKNSCNDISCNPNVPNGLRITGNKLTEDSFNQPSLNSDGSFECELYYPFRKNSALLIDFFLYAVNSDENNLTDFSILEWQVGKEKLTRSIKIPFVYRTEMTGFSSSKETKLFNLSSNSEYVIDHSYDIRNNGIGTMPHLEIEIVFPVLENFSGDFYNKSECCMTSSVEVKLNKKNKKSIIEPYKNIQLTSQISSSNKLLPISKQLENTLKLEERHLILNCEIVFCQKIVYKIKNLSIDDSLDINIKINFTSNLLEKLKSLTTFQYTSNALVSPWNISIYKANYSDQCCNQFKHRLQIKTKASRQQKEEPFPYILIIICIATGFIILLILILILWKCGFFRRQIHAKLLEEKKNLIGSNKAVEEPIESIDQKDDEN